MEVIKIALKLITPPTIEPVTLDEVKLHLRLSSSSMAGTLTTVQSIVPGAQVVAADYGLVGTGVDVLGYRALVNLNSGTNGAGGKVDVKIQEANEDVDAKYIDWYGGVFEQVTEANDNAVQEIEYTGIKRYIRVVATVAVADCDFGADVIREQSYNTEDTLLTSLTTTARKYCAGFQNRAYITQTWSLWLDNWPSGNSVRIPLPPLQKINSVKYYGTDDAEHTMSATDYFTDDKSEPGRLVLAYGKSWPSASLRPANGVCIEFDAGYGDAAADVPAEVKQAMLLLIGNWYENREATVTGIISREIEFAVRSLLWLDRVVPI